MRDWGVFSDEGLIDGPLCRADADTAALLHRSDYRKCGYDPTEITVREICHDHDDQPADACEECNTEEA